MEAACHLLPDTGNQLIKGILRGLKEGRAARMSVCGTEQSHYRNDDALRIKP